MTAAYDEIADWYEQEFLARTAGTDALGITRALHGLLGPGRGVCLEIGCGTGVHAADVRKLGWTPAGVDLSGAMLQYARGRLPVARADAGRLPVRDSSVPAAGRTGDQGTQTRVVRPKFAYYAGLIGLELAPPGGGRGAGR